jgi:WbqC-like protein family
MNCVILQPSYIPWRGYFHQIQKADLFIFYDDVQYEKRGWRNRNRIKTPAGLLWLTIPVFAHGAQVVHTPIYQVSICWDEPWNQKHWKSIQHSYARAPYFRKYASMLEEKFMAHPEFLADFTIPLTIDLARELGISHTRFMRSSEIPDIRGAKTDRLIAILGHVGATNYISGPSARNYIEAEKFLQAGITLEFMEYNYPEYNQLYPPFEPQVTILDLIFMTGPKALDYITG